MPERTVKVNLVAQVNGYINGMETAARKTRELGSEAERLAQKRQAFEDLGRPLLAFGVIAAAAVGIAVKKFAEFDAAMSQVNAVTQETPENLNKLRDAALEAGGATVFTATEAANAIEELGKAGLSTADILDGALSGALSLAASGQLEVARAAEITATTLKQFNLDGSQAGHVADVLSAGAGKALGSVEDLAQGLKYVGPVAASMGVSLEETTGALALFADQGIIGEQAGTSLRGAISSLVSPSAEAGKELERLGISLFDSNKEFIGVAGTAGVLSDAYKGMDEQSRSASLGLIFGNQQLTAARILFESGAGAVRKYTDEVNDTGYAARVAADRLDNLQGDVEKLGGAFDTALIKGGSGANEVLRSLVQAVTFLVDGVGELPQPVLDAGLAVGVAAAAIGLAGGAALLGVPKLAAFKVAMDDIGTSGKKVAVGVGLVGGAVAAATLILSAFIQEQAASKARVDEFASSLDQATGATTRYTRELVVQKLQEKNAFESAKQFGISQKELTDAVLLGGEAYSVVNNKLEAYGDGLTGNQKRAADLRASQSAAAIAVRGTREELADAEEAYRNTTAATDDNTDSTMSASVAYRDAASNASELQTTLDELVDTINKANGVGQDAVSTNASYQDALAEVVATIAEAQNGAEGFSTSLDESTAAGSKNADMFADLAQKSQDAAKAQFDLDHNADTYYARLQNGRQTLYDQIVALTGNADAAQALTDKIYAIPTQREIEILADTQRAAWTIDDFIARMGQKVGVINFRAQLPDLNGSVSGNGRFGTFAGGGYTGDGAVDDAAGIVHRGEWVSTAETVEKPSNRAALEYMHAGGDIAKWSASSAQGMWLSAPPSQPTGGGSDAAVTALMDPGFIRAVRQLAERPIDVSVDGQVLAVASQRGSATRAALGSD